MGLVAGCAFIKRVHRRPMWRFLSDRKRRYQRVILCVALCSFARMALCATWRFPEGALCHVALPGWCFPGLPMWRFLARKRHIGGARSTSTHPSTFSHFASQPKWRGSVAQWPPRPRGLRRISGLIGSTQCSARARAPGRVSCRHAHARGTPPASRPRAPPPPPSRPRLDARLIRSYLLHLLDRRRGASVSWLCSKAIPTPRLTVSREQFTCACHTDED